MYHVTIDARPTFRKEDSGRVFNRHIVDIYDALKAVTDQITTLQMEGYTSFQITIETDPRREIPCIKTRDSQELILRQAQLAEMSRGTIDALRQHLSVVDPAAKVYGIHDDVMIEASSPAKFEQIRKTIEQLLTDPERR